MHYAYELHEITETAKENYLDIILKEMEDYMYSTAIKGQDRIEICFNFLYRQKVTYWSDKDCNNITDILKKFGYEIVSVRKEHPYNSKYTLYFVTIKW